MADALDKRRIDNAKDLRTVVDSDDIVYPEHEKLALIKDQSQAIGEFIEWLRDQGVHFVTYGGTDGDYPIMWRTDITGILADFFDIDQDKIELEKRAMLGSMRAANDAALNERSTGT